MCHAQYDPGLGLRPIHAAANMSARRDRCRRSACKHSTKKTHHAASLCPLELGRCSDNSEYSRGNMGANTQHSPSLAGRRATQTRSCVRTLFFELLEVLKSLGWYTRLLFRNWNKRDHHATGIGAPCHRNWRLDACLRDLERVPLVLKVDAEVCSPGDNVGYAKSLTAVKWYERVATQGSSKLRPT